MFDRLCVQVLVTQDIEMSIDLFKHDLSFFTKHMSKKKKIQRENKNSISDDEQSLSDEIDKM